MSSFHTIFTPQTIQVPRRYVHLVTQDTRLADSLSQQIEHFGYVIQQVNDLESLAKAIAEKVALVIIFDMDSADLRPAELPLSKTLTRLKLHETPLIFLSVENNQAKRLQAIRAGGLAFFPKPVDIINLVDKLDEQDITGQADPYRVLIVEDQAPVANYYKVLLRMAGMDARVVIDSTQMMENMIDFHPDLILMDLYMPNADGAELAKMIRQMDEYVSIPIVFLSIEDDFEKRIEMMGLGSDDYLIKPIKANHLVAIVRSRLERLKTLRTYMVRDSLTGLLNHTGFRGILSQEVNRCKRHQTRIALAMIDLDHFKNVNDAYGHAAGDIVLKGLSRLLNQRLRKSDIIGRYGGEEFVALFLDADLEEAYNILDELRIHFSEIEFRPVPDKALSVTFSGGIATFPEYTTVKELSNAADIALYQAKASGRNRIVLASPDHIAL